MKMDCIGRIVNMAVYYQINSQECVLGNSNFSVAVLYLLTYVVKMDGLPTSKK